MRLLRMDGLSDKRGQRRSSNYAAIKAGLLPPALKMGESSVWPEFEVDIVIAAQISGKTDNEIREIVKQLVANRPNVLDELLARSKPVRPVQSPTA